MKQVESLDPQDDGRGDALRHGLQDGDRPDMTFNKKGDVTRPDYRDLDLEERSQANPAKIIYADK